MKVVTVVGARPQFVKAAPVSRALRAAGHVERLIHTGQHYDPSMSQVFFDELEVPAPAANLEVGSGPHGWQTGTMLARLEALLVDERPDRVLVYGDTNSTLAGALAAAKLRIPLAHVEAGLRSFDRDMPEETNRVLTDHASDLLLCPTPLAVANLAREGITRGVLLVGDPMADAVRLFAPAGAARAASLHARLGLSPGRYAVATVHRPKTTDDPACLAGVLGALAALDLPVVLPLHPRTRSRLPADFAPGPALRLVEPLGYLDLLGLVGGARQVLTDSGGLQKEAYLLGVPCVTLREETEWVETLDAGWNVLAGADPARIREASRALRPPAARPELYGDGHASDRIAAAL